MTERTYETKSAEAIGADFADFMQAFEEFKATNDERLSQMEHKASSDVVTDEKLERINRRLDELALKQARPGMVGGDVVRKSAGLQHKAAFETYVRRGESGALRELESKALSVVSNPDGGYLVPAETEAEVMRSLKSVSPIRAIAGIRQVSGSVYKKPFSISGPGTGWVGETAARPETASPMLAELSFPTMELYAMPAATASLLEDAAVDMDAWIAEEVRDAFARQEGQAFVVGDGVNKPRGFADYPTVDNASWTWGNIGTISTGVSGAFPAADASDVLIDLVYALKAEYRANAHFVMNRATQAAIRKFKDVDGNYIWQPSHVAGELPSLLGHPVAEAEDMPSIGADAHAIAFGDFRRGYLIVDRVGLRVLRDPFSSKPYVLFYTTKRVGGGVQDFDAIKLLKFGA